VSGVKTSRSKPQKLWRRYSGNGEVPEQLKLAVEKVLRAARS
jgi:hypothetical protein